MEYQELDERMETMARADFMTIRWNNILSLGLGLPALIYVIFAFSSSAWTTKGGMIGLAVIGVIY